ncbi:hypothetical protein [Paenibacillus sp. SAF-068]|uniref:hypothetical protein n=1 Tax=Paenibacillus sp. SAF-068 TaxID=3436864 RepID=UPI003F7D6DBE
MKSAITREATSTAIALEVASLVMFSGYLYQERPNEDSVSHVDVQEHTIWCR